jgi:hypothetical protein
MSLEGANCADLPPVAIDKYFDCDVAREPFRAKVAKMICARCVVRAECLDEALVMPNLQRRGVIAGLSVNQVHAARRWRIYEQGITDKVPEARRPDWLPMTEATHHVEQLRLELDPDEPAENPDLRRTEDP